MKQELRSGLGLQEAADPATRAGPPIVAVGNVIAWRKSCGNVPEYQDLKFVSVEDILRGALEMHGPQLVVSPVVTPEFDCLDLAFTLVRLGYSGAYRAVARNIPNPAMIVREVKSHCPAMDFDVIPVTDMNIRMN